ncbi:glycosyltransferase family 2 protein [Brevibacillus dissolubilis]|uniref:glycosyltransferase family 2 protein n=1 Tax=Brevibacillus dissolubilis TaxID=1844116 RepID=UPI001115B96A|nr:glycosyltransferase family 2 protein [Brevibacillus dissolubilis]
MKSTVKRMLSSLSANRTVRQLFASLPYPVKEQAKKLLKGVIKHSVQQRTVVHRTEIKRVTGYRPLVSVILPVYNHDEFLPGAIESVLRQTYPHLELVIVDDGSDRILLDGIRPYLTDPRVRYVRQEHGGLPIGLNTGFRFAQGEFLTWTSADNIMGESNIEELVSGLLDSPTSSLIYADYAIIDSTGQRLRDSSFRVHNQYDADTSVILLPEDPAPLTRVHDNFIGPSFMYRRLMTTIGSYDDSIGVEDYDYWARGFTFFPLLHFPLPSHLYEYRVHDDSLSAKARELRIAEKAKNLLQRVDLRGQFLKKQQVILEPAFTIHYDVLKDELTTWCQTTSGQPVTEDSIVVTDFGRHHGIPPVTPRLTIVLVDHDHPSLYEIVPDEAVVYLATDHDAYLLLRRLHIRAFYVEELSNLAGAISALIAAKLFDPAPKQAVIQMIQTKSLQIHTPWKPETDTTALSMLNPLQTFGHQLHTDASALTPDVILTNDACPDRTLYPTAPVGLLVTEESFFSQVIAPHPTDVFLCTRKNLMCRLEQQGVPREQLYWIGDLSEAPSLRHIESVMLQALIRSGS